MTFRASDISGLSRWLICTHVAGNNPSQLFDCSCTSRQTIHGQTEMVSIVLQPVCQTVVSNVDIDDIEKLCLRDTQ